MIMIEQAATTQHVEHIARVTAAIATDEQRLFAVTDPQRWRPITATFPVRWHRTRHKKAAARKAVCALVAERECNILGVHPVNPAFFGR
jgi:hypothetical protein